MPRVYVVGALLRGGGSLMAYRLGCLLHRHFGYELYDACVGSKIKPSNFRYDVPIKTITTKQMVRDVRKDDILIVNAAFSGYLFGLMLPCRKICYVQGFQTFEHLDCQFDLYVAVSHVVQGFLKSVYNITAPVIPAFIDLDRMPEVKPWHERPEKSALVYMKNPCFEHDLLLKELRSTLKKRGLHIDLSNVIKGRNVTHEEFLKRVGAVRCFVNVSLAEGFGLVPLEAMAMGTMVTGLDGLAGRDYMRQTENCLVGSITDLRTLTDVVQQAFTDDALAARCAAGGLKTAQSYGYNAFEEAWLKELSVFLQKEPADAPYKKGPLVKRGPHLVT